MQMDVRVNNTLGLKMT